VLAYPEFLDTMMHLTIGGYAIHIENTGPTPSHRWPWPAYAPFVTADSPDPDIRLTVTVIAQMPLVGHGPLLFDSEHGLWQLYQHDEGYFFESLDTITHHARCRAQIDANFSSATVWLLGDYEQSLLHWQPGHLFNPLIQVCLLSKLGRDGGFLLHASGIVTKHGTWVFTGDSGAGKSTLAGWFGEQGGIILNDERLLIKPQGDSLSVWGTPWAGSLGEGQNRQGKLARLHCIRHGSDRHRLIRLSSETISRLVLRQCFFPHWDPEALAGMLGGLRHLVERMDCVGLSFLNNPNVIDFLIDHPLDHAMATS